MYHVDDYEKYKKELGSVSLSKGVKIPFNEKWALNFSSRKNIIEKNETKFVLI